MPFTCGDPATLLRSRVAHLSTLAAFAVGCRKPGPRCGGYVAVACSGPGGELGEAGGKR